MKKHIPNMLTCCNLISGCIATFYAFQSNYLFALSFIIIGAVFDFFDGFMARLLHVSSPIGKELDSLADDITFGFAPSAVVFSLLRGQLSMLSQAGITLPETLAALLPYAAFIMAAFSGLRLAKFNLDERQATSFIGLPTPANALFWSSLAYSLQPSSATECCGQWIALLTFLGIFVSSWLLVAEIPMFALKFKSYDLKSNKLRYAFLLLSVFLLLIGGLSCLPLVIVCYVLLSLAQNYLGTKAA